MEKPSYGSYSSGNLTLRVTFKWTSNESNIGEPKVYIFWGVPIYQQDAERPASCIQHGAGSEWTPSWVFRRSRLTDIYIRTYTHIYIYTYINVWVCRTSFWHHILHKIVRQAEAELGQTNRFSLWTHDLSQNVYGQNVYGITEAIEVPHFLSCYSLQT